MRRLPVYLLIDVSGSMSGEPIESVRNGLQMLVAALTLTIRLMGNMFGDHAIVAILLALCAPFVPAVMMTLPCL